MVRLFIDIITLQMEELCRFQYHFPLEPVDLNAIHSFVLDHSRKLFSKQYDTEIIECFVKGKVVYYRCFHSVILLLITDTFQIEGNFVQEIV